MLAIQPISVSNSKSISSSRPVFKGGWDKKSLEDERSFIENQREELDNLINDTHIPEPIKKPFKFFRILANGAIDGIAVFGSVMMLASFLKKGSNSKIVNKVADTVKPMGAKAASGAQKLADAASAFIKKAAASKYGQKVVDTFKKLASTDKGKKILYKGKRILVRGRKLLRKLAAILNKVLSPMKKVTKDGATKGIATGLGIGSGLSGAYEASMENQDLSALDEVDEVEE